MNAPVKHPILYLSMIAFALQGCGSGAGTAAPSATPGQARDAEPASPAAPTPSAGSSGVTIEVTSAEDSGSGTLRNALQEAEIGDTIFFTPSAFPPTNPQTITLASELPEIGQGHLIIDASEAGVILDGGQIGAPETVGLRLVSDNNTIRGLQIVGFSLAGVALSGGAQNNTVGGDRGLGSGPLGQGNLITSDGNFGVALWNSGTSFNTIEGNYIGTDVSGSTSVGALSQGIFSEGADHNLVTGNVIGGFEDHGVGLCCAANGNNTVRGNWIGTDPSRRADLARGNSHGVAIDRSGHNLVGPDNVIAHNGKAGIVVLGQESVGNQITQNSIYDNGGSGDAFLALGIELWDGGNEELAAPVLLDFDLQAGTLAGMACPGCSIEVFSDGAEEGAVFEGEATADAMGHFEVISGVAFRGPHLTATSTDATGNTSQLSPPTPSITSRQILLQLDNSSLFAPLVPKTSDELVDNRIGGGWETLHILRLGATRASFSLNSIEWHTVDWSQPEFEIPPQLDDWVSTMADNGVELTVTLSFWDKANHPGGWEEEPGYSRFRTQEEIDRYLEFVLFVVEQLGDRVRYYELWNEPDNQGFPVQYIEIPDYANLVQQVAPAIREEDPEAEIVVGSVSNLQYTQDYLFRMVRSDEIMPLADVIAWHPFYGASPSYGYDAQFGDPRKYYYDYPSIVEAIMDTAEDHGFEGEYYVDEMGWPTAETAVEDQPWVYSPTEAAKYYTRGVIMHLGMGILTEPGAMTAAFVPSYAAVRNLSTIMAGATPGDVAWEIEGSVEALRSYSFSLPSGEKLIALWLDGPAEDHDPGVPATVAISEPGARSAVGIDVLHGFQQPLRAEEQGGDLIIQDLLVKDYPILLLVGR